MAKKTGILIPCEGCMYILAMYYPRYELQWRFGMFFPSSTLAGAFGGVSILQALRRFRAAN